MPDTPRKPRLDDRGDIAAHPLPTCPSCGEPLAGAGSRLRVVSVEEYAYDIALLVADMDGTWRVVANPDDAEFLATRRSFAICAACTQEIDVKEVVWEGE